ncbi:efflux RND transporter periplasmic adaptor subunit [Desulfomonile tiedjei]|uniref:RND family efflux transporter, MFP subunit n=1 Tax=Desulfomonile tiedjei (strain ATCC 49306 / DSM 6799 / DCB-1) TaxID=706587 RepID=I4C2F6_DESTA|nr:efflux RND transporter periplasmic adaptor subunit [Desulfomonile tiedjei]AFM23747.1 RND family efflux transporter, MFP subunit [Desulfomonile tiedjei DSM 6799]
MKTRSVKALVVVCLLAIVLVGCDKKPQSGFDRPPAPVSVVSAVTQDVPVYLDGIGKTVAREVVSIQPQVSGRITKIHFTDGADLKTGDLLFTIDPRPYEAQLASAEGTLAEKKAQLELAKIQFNRYADLLKTNSVSQQEYDQRKNTLDVAQAQVRQSEAAVETARLNLDYCSIRSPIDGRAGQRLVDIGNVVAANTGSLLVIERLDPIYADFTIAETDLTAVQRNMRQGTLKVEVRLPDEPTRPRDGKLTFLDNAVQEGTGTVKLRSTIANSDHYFWPGRFVKVRLVLSTLKEAVLVPADAPQMSAKGEFVYVIKQDSTAELRPVKLGQRQDELVVVEQGLKPDERVVVSGQIAVTPGAQVHVQESRSVQTRPAGNKENES